LRDFQAWNAQVYGVVNDQNYQVSDIVSRIHRYVTHVLKLVRKEKRDDADFLLAMAASWTFALANRLHIDLQDELWQRFPGKCPYCGAKPCSCKERAKKRRTLRAGRTQMPQTLSEFQAMLRTIYPDNTLRDSVMHLAEEAGEVDEAVDAFRRTHDRKYLEEVKLELVDVLTNLCAVGSCWDIDLADALAEHFSKGCHACGKAPCRCGYMPIADSVRA
jgi:NTP pyrophosphatase (non-canonical NTP hydrolase)